LYRSIISPVKRSSSLAAIKLRQYSSSLGGSGGGCSFDPCGGDVGDLLLPSDAGGDGDEARLGDRGGVGGRFFAVRIGNFMFCGTGLSCNVTL
jgi:hypothetical protein